MMKLLFNTLICVALLLAKEKLWCMNPTTGNYFSEKRNSLFSKDVIFHSCERLTVFYLIILDQKNKGLLTHIDNKLLLEGKKMFTTIKKLIEEEYDSKNVTDFLEGIDYALKNTTIDREIKRGYSKLAREMFVVIKSLQQQTTFFNVKNNDQQRQNDLACIYYVCHILLNKLIDFNNQQRYGSSQFCIIPSEQIEPLFNANK